MKKVLLFCMILSSLHAISQTVISDSPFASSDPSARLDIQSTTKGLLIPRMDDDQRDLINGGSPANGLLIYNTDESCFQFYNGVTSTWSCLTTGSGLDSTDDAWVNDSATNRIMVGTLSDATTARTNANSLLYLRDDGKLIFGDNLSTGEGGQADHSGFFNIRRSTGAANLKLSSSDGSGTIWMEGYGATPVFNFAHGRGTDSDDFSTQITVQDGDILGGIHFWGYNDNTTRPAEQMAFSAAIRGEVDGTVTTGTNAGVPTRLTFTTTDETEAAIPSITKMVLDSKGRLSVEGSITTKEGISANIRSLGTGSVLESDHTVLVTGSISLPAATDHLGKILYLVHGSAGTHTITANFINAGGTFATYDLNGTAGGTRITVQSDGTNWWIINVN